MKFAIIMLFNLLIIVCFTWLAKIYEHWWIVLFAYFLLYRTDGNNPENRGD